MPFLIIYLELRFVFSHYFLFIYFSSLFFPCLICFYISILLFSLLSSWAIFTPEDTAAISCRHVSLISSLFDFHLIAFSYLFLHDYAYHFIAPPYVSFIVIISFFRAASDYRLRERLRFSPYAEFSDALQLQRRGFARCDGESRRYALAEALSATDSCAAIFLRRQMHWQWALRLY